MASLSRFPYPEYHSDKDTIAIISQESLAESVSVLERVVQQLDKTILVRKRFEGVMAVSNPAFNLYVDPGQPAFGTLPDDRVKRLRFLMDLLPLYPKNRFLNQIADDVGLPLEEVRDYLLLWQEKGLLELI